MAPFITLIIMLETTVASFIDKHLHQTIKPPHHPVRPSTGVFQLYQDADNLKDRTTLLKSSVAEVEEAAADLQHCLSQHHHSGSPSKPSSAGGDRTTLVHTDSFTNPGNTFFDVIHMPRETKKNQSPSFQRNP